MYKSGNAATQIDFILFPRAMRTLVTDVKVIPGKEVALQHQLLVCDMKFDVPPKPKRKFTPHLKVWKLTDPQRRNHFQEVFKLHVSASAGVPDAATEDIWNNLKTGLLKTTEEVCGTTRPHRWRRETWWWNEHVGEVITAKRQAFKAWKTGKGTRASYYAAKRIARRAVHHARQEADKEVYKNIDPKSSELYHLANQLRKELLARLGMEDLDLILKERRLRWYEHVERSNGAVKTAFDIQVNGKRGPGRPKMTWKQLTERDRREWKLSAIDPHDRDTWRSGVRSAMRAASQLP